MEYIQVRKPRYTVRVDAGMCYDYGEQVFNIDSAVIPTAWSGWETAKKKHKNRNFPKGVTVPLFFEWTGNIGYGIYSYGHLAVRDASGTLYSSPGYGFGYMKFNTIEELENYFGGGMEYVGWTEDMSGYTIVKKKPTKGETMLDKNGSDALYLFYLGKRTSSWGKQNAIGKMTAKQLQSHLLKSAAYKARVKDMEVGKIDLSDHLPSKLKQAYDKFVNRK